MLGHHEGGNERYIDSINKSLNKNRVKTLLLRNNWLNSNILRLVLQIPWLVYKNSIKIVHSTYIAPLFHVCKSVVTIHDLSFKKYPQFYSFKDSFIFNVLLPISLKNADAIIVPSIFTKKELIKYYPSYKNKIFTIYYGSDNIFKKQKTNNFKEQFLLTINSKNPRKNINNIIRAFNKLSEKNNKLNLIVIGGKDNIESKISNNSKIKFYEYVSEKKLIWLYSNCKIFIANSLYEGFDFPIIEALRCGTFVIASDIDVHREITDNKLIYTNQNNYLDLYAKLKYYLSRPLLIKDIANKTSKIAQKYTWSKSAKETLRVYSWVLKK